MLADALAPYGIEGESDLVDAVRFLRSALHGFVALELAGGFAMARSTDTSFDAAVAGLDRALAGWAADLGRLATRAPQSAPAHGAGLRRRRPSRS